MRYNKKNAFSRAVSLGDSEPSFMCFALLVLGLVCFFPEISFAAEVTLHNQLDTYGGTVKEKIAPILLSVVMLFSALISAVKGTFGPFAMSCVVLIVYGAISGWIQGGLTLGGQGA